MIRILSFLAVLGAVAGAQTWNCANDFSPVSNPNGAWSYGWQPSLGGTFNLITTTSSCGAVQGWSGAGPLSLNVNTGSAAVCCATWSTPPHTLLFHPGWPDRATYRWTAPFAGTFAVAASFAGGDYAYPTTTDVAVEVNGALVYALNINSYSGGPQCASTGFTPAGSFQGTYSLAAGSTIDTSLGYGTNANYFGDATLAAIVITGPYAASATPVGTGCGGGGNHPVLACTPPVVGQNVTLSIANGTPLKSGELFASAVPAAPIDLGSGCAVYLDFATYFPLIDPIATDSSGAWSLTLGVPNNPGLIGATLALQGALFGTAGPLGVDITNGVVVVVGL